MFAVETYLAAAGVCDAAAGVASPHLKMVNLLKDLAQRKYFPIFHPSQHDVLLDTAKKEYLEHAVANGLDVSTNAWGWQMNPQDGVAQAVREIVPGLWVTFKGALTPTLLFLHVEMSATVENPPAPLEMFRAEVQFSRKQAVLKTLLSFSPLDLSEIGADPAFYREIVTVLRQFRNLAYFTAQSNVAQSVQSIYSRTLAELPERSRNGQ